MKPITVVGSYNTGITMRVNRIPVPGETLRGTGFSEGPGGKGSNQAIAARRLGGRVSLVGCVGRDKRGDAAMELWKREGVSAEFVRRSERYTGLGFVIVGDDGSNAITIDPGANLDLGPHDVARAESLIRSSSVLLLQLETDIGVAAAASKIGKEDGVRVILNPAPGRRAEELDLGSVEILTPNETEFRELTGADDVEAGARSLLRMGPSAVIVTRGQKGVHVTTTSDSYSIPAPVVKVVDTTGAGDAFNGALAVALSEGKPLRQAVSFANYAGALATTKREAVPSLPIRAEVDEFRKNEERE